MTPRIRTLIGNDTFKAAVGKDCRKQLRDIVPKPRIILLDKGNGRSALTEFAGDSYAACSYFQPHETPFVELSFDGAAENLNKQLACLESHAVYTNHYKGVISVEAEKLAAHRDSPDYAAFPETVREMAEHAAVLCFFSREPSKDEKALMKALADEMPMDTLCAEPYTPQQLYEIFIGALGHVRIREAKRFKAEAAALLSEYSTAKEVTRAAHQLLHLAERDKKTHLPVISPQLLTILKGDNRP